MKKIVLILSMFYSALLPGAGPYVHLYLADQFIKNFTNYEENEKKQFILGTLYPDIRYLGVQTKEDTHFEVMTFDEVLLETSPFFAGMKFHSFVDIERAHIADQHTIYDSLEASGFPNDSAFLKLVEDEIVFQPWDEYREYLKTTYGEELEISKEDVVNWHRILSKYLIGPPSVFLATLEKNNQAFLSFSKEQITEWSHFIKPMTENTFIVDYIEAMLKHFEMMN